MVCAAGCVVLAGSSAAPVVPPGDIAFLPAQAYIVRAFQTYPLVALSEMHGNAESKALFAAVVRDSTFQALVSDIVVEFGNAWLQDVVDRYVAGDDVPPDDLRRIWRDTTQVIVSRPVRRLCCPAAREPLEAVLAELNGDVGLTLLIRRLPMHVSPRRTPCPHVEPTSSWTGWWNEVSSAVA